MTKQERACLGFQNQDDAAEHAIYEAARAIGPLTPDMLCEALYAAWTRDKIAALARDLTIALE